MHTSTAKSHRKKAVKYWAFLCPAVKLANVIVVLVLQAVRRAYLLKEFHVIIAAVQALARFMEGAVESIALGNGGPVIFCEFCGRASAGGDNVHFLFQTVRNDEIVRHSQAVWHHRVLPSEKVCGNVWIIKIRDTFLVCHSRCAALVRGGRWLTASLAKFS
eukprot:SAG31_NODE_6631_length_1944_cov_1.502981_1_plen_161_part_00